MFIDTAVAAAATAAVMNLEHHQTKCVLCECLGCSFLVLHNACA